MSWITNWVGERELCSLVQSRSSFYFPSRLGCMVQRVESHIDPLDGAFAHEDERPHTPQQQRQRKVKEEKVYIRWNRCCSGETKEGEHETQRKWMDLLTHTTHPSSNGRMSCAPAAVGRACVQRYIVRPYKSAFFYRYIFCFSSSSIRWL